MAYRSVDELQKVLADTAFQYAADRKKASGRALGTLVEIITFYLLRSWKFRDNIVIEKALPEFGNPSITHNVEFSLHGIRRRERIVLPELRLPISLARLKAAIERFEPLVGDRLRSTSVVSARRRTS